MLNILGWCYIFLYKKKLFLAIEIKLVNDQRKPVEMISSSIFIDNKPVLNAMLKLGKRKSVDIKFSNVHSAHFDEYNEVELFKLKMWSTFKNSFMWIVEFVSRGKVGSGRE